MGTKFNREPVSLAALALALAAQSSTALAQDGTGAGVPAQETESADPAEQPASIAPPEADEPPQEITKTIVVTGSRIPRPNLTAVSPVTVIDEVEVKLEGAILAEELLNQFPQVAPSGGQFISNGTSGTSTVDLRDIGPQRTLVLVNGHRLGPGDAITPVPDINLIPPTLIKRVDILTGGASSVYGSDAVAGVVNFILDTSFEGLRVDGQASVYQHDNRNGSGLVPALEDRGFDVPRGNTVDGGRQDINAAYGAALFDDRLHVQLYAGYKHLEPLTQDSRDYSACTAQVDNPPDEVLFCGGSFASFPGNFATNFDVLTLGSGRTFVPGAIPFNFGPWNFYQRSGRRYTAGGFADAEISRAFHPYVEAMWMDDRTLAQIAPSANFGNTEAINCDNPLLSDQQKSIICVDGNFTGQFVFENADGSLEIIGQPEEFVDPVTGNPYRKANFIVARRGVESGGRQEDFRHKDIHVLGGFKGDVGRGITYDASYLYARTKMSDAHLNDFLTSRLENALDVITDPATGQPACRSVLTGEDPACVPWDIFEIGAVTPEATAYLNVPSFLAGTTIEQVANANATIDFGEFGVTSPWASESPAINVGAEYRKDELTLDPDEHYQTGDLSGLGTNILPLDASTDAKEVFIEIRLPIIDHGLVERLSFEGGFRHSLYTAGDSKTSSNAYKLALDLTPIRGLRFRASQQRAVRAPNVVEFFAPPFTDGFFHDPCVGALPDATPEECARTGLDPALYGHVLPLPNSDFSIFNAIGGGNQELEPEEALTRTLGVVLEPAMIPGLNATIDWWDINLDGAISFVDGDTIIDNCAALGDPIFCDRIHRDSNGSLWLSPQGFIDTRLFNLGSFHVRGIDVGVNYRHRIGSLGSATAEFLGSYTDKWTVNLGGLAEPIECAGTYGIGCGPPTPRWRHKARLSFETNDGVTLSMNWRYTGSMSLAPLLDIEPGKFTKKIDPQSYFDLAALFRVEKNFTFRIGVNNIFDREPPLVPGGTGGCGLGCNGNTYPQWYDPLGRYIFGGFTFTL